MPALGRPHTYGVNCPSGMTIDKTTGNLYVANYGSSQILVYNSADQQLTNLTIKSGIYKPNDVAVDKGLIYVTNEFLPQSNNGKTPATTVFDAAGHLVRTIYSPGKAQPDGIAIDSLGRIWIAANQSGTSGEVNVFSSTGKVLQSHVLTAPEGIGFDARTHNAWIVGSLYLYSYKLNGALAGGGKTTSSMNFIAGAPNGDLIGNWNATHSIVVFNSSGKMLRFIKSASMYPSGIAVAKNGDFYVSDCNSQVITKYSAAGKVLSTIH